MADLSKVLSLNQERANSMESKTLKTRTKVNTVRGRPAVRELDERSIYERTIMSERSIEGYAISNQLFTVKLRRLVWSQKKKTKTILLFKEEDQCNLLMLWKENKIQTKKKT